MKPLMMMTVQRPRYLRPRLGRKPQMITMHIVHRKICSR